jgi:hypothetical protein
MYDYVPLEKSINLSASSGVDCLHHDALHLTTFASYNSQGHVVLIFYYEILDNDFNFMMPFAM